MYNRLDLSLNVFPPIGLAAKPRVCGFIISKTVHIFVNNTFQDILNNASCVRPTAWLVSIFLEFIIVYSRFPQNLVPHKFFQKLLILHLVINRNNLGIFSHFTFFNLWHSIHQSVCLKVDLLLRCFLKTETEIRDSLE